MSSQSIAERIAKQLEDYLGPHTARTAVKTFAKRSLNIAPEDLILADVPVLLEALRPMLRTLLGEKSAEVLLTKIKQEWQQ